MAVKDNYLQFVSAQLARIGEFETKKMFGGIGFFKDGQMFGMIGNDVFRLKADKTTQADFEKFGMKPYYSGSKKKGMPYWEVPEVILDDPKALAKWALKSISINTKK